MGKSLPGTFQTANIYQLIKHGTGEDKTSMIRIKWIDTFSVLEKFTIVGHIEVHTGKIQKGKIWGCIEFQVRIISRSLKAAVPREQISSLSETTSRNSRYSRVGLVRSTSKGVE